MAYRNPFPSSLEQFVQKMLEKGFEPYVDDGEEVFLGKYLGDDVEDDKKDEENNGNENVEMNSQTE